MKLSILKVPFLLLSLLLLSLFPLTVFAATATTASGAASLGVIGSVFAWLTTHQVALGGLLVAILDFVFSLNSKWQSNSILHFLLLSAQTLANSSGTANAGAPPGSPETGAGTASTSPPAK